MSASLAFATASRQTEDLSSAAIMRLIQEHQQQLTKKEQQVVGHYLALGVLLAALRQRGGVALWKSRVQQLGYHPRKAYRLSRLGRWWLAQQLPVGLAPPEKGGAAEAGPRAGGSGDTTLGVQPLPAMSSFLEKLPADMIKLECLSRLAPEQLEQLLATLDCRQVGRQRVAEAVHALLRQPMAEAVDDEVLVQQLQQQLDRWVAGFRAKLEAIPLEIRQGPAYAELRADLHDRMVKLDLLLPDE
jgi:hypothetical protein